MSAPATIGRTAWIAYLTLAVPMAFLSLAMLLGGVQALYAPFETLEVPRHHGWMKPVAWAVFAAFLAAWTFGLLGAHRFNAPRRFLIPFLSNLLAATGLLGLGTAMMLQGDGGIGLVLAYVGVLEALLVVGTLAALADRRKAPASGDLR